MNALNVNKNDSVSVSENGGIEMNGHALGIAIPADLDGAKYNRLSKLELNLRPDDFIQAWNGIIYRLRAAVDAESLYTSTKETDHQAKYEKANSFFGFFVASLSTIECFYFALYSAGANLDSKIFHLGKDEKSKKNIVPTVTRDSYIKFDSACTLTKELDALLVSNEYKELCDIRNYLAHQGNPSMNYRKGFGASAGNDGQSVTIKQHVIEYDSNTIRQRLHWLIDELNNMMSAAEELYNKHNLRFGT